MGTPTVAPAASPSSGRVPAPSRIGVVERGEAAVRILTALGGLVVDGGPPTTTVLFTTERESPWYGREADDVVHLPGRPSPAGDLSPSIDEWLDAFGRAQVDTVWIGRPAVLGTVTTHGPTERAALLAACARRGLSVIGPDPATVERLLGAGSLTELATAAGLGVGRRPEPGQGSCRLIDVDVLVDHAGTVWALDCRDVSLRRGDEPVMVESPPAASAHGPDDAALSAWTSAAARVAEAAGLHGAAVVTLRVDDAGQPAGRIELVGVDTVATPLHATTEERTGTSVIGWRLRLAHGASLDRSAPAGEGVVVEARLMAVDIGAGPDGSDRVAGGRVALLSFPVGTGVRIDANRRPGDPVSSDDPLLAVITAWGPDRAVAIGRLRRALARTAVVVDGGVTNRAFLLDLLGRDDVASGRTDCSWLDAVVAAGDPAPPDPLALVAGAIEAYEADRSMAEVAFFATAERGRPERPEDVGAALELAYRGVPYVVQVDRTAARQYAVRLGDQVAEVTYDRLNEFERRLACAGRRHRAVVTPSGHGVRVELDGVAHRVEREDGIVVRAAAPALVVAPLVQPGQTVTAGTPIAVLESMKMETTVTAPFDGEVLAVSVVANSQVEGGAPLMRIRPLTSRAVADHAPAEPLGLAGLERRVDTTRKPCDRVYEPLGNYLLGYDLAHADLRRLLTQQRRLAEIAAPDDADLLACEDGLLDIYAELGALYRPTTEASGEPGDDVTTENTQEYLTAFLQWLDADRAGLPEPYRARLRTALARYGVTSLRSPQLREALMWLFRSVTRLGELGPVVTAILERRLAHADAVRPHTGADGRARLERLASATDGRQQAIADLARDVEFRDFDEPPMLAAAAELDAEMSAHLAVLTEHPDAPDRAERIARLVWCPNPLRSLLLTTWRAAGPHATAVRDLVLEIHLRRFYRIRQLGEIRFVDAGAVRVAACDYPHDGQPVQLWATYCPLADAPAAMAALAPLADAVPPGTQIVVDLVTWTADPLGDVQRAADDAAATLAPHGWTHPLHRLDLTVTHDRAGGTVDAAAGDTADQPGDEHLRTRNLTFRQDADGSLVEERLYRNLHPMLAKRLEIWRLANFELERLASPEDVYLFLGVARTNPKDRRLFALAEVRDLTPAQTASPGTDGSRTSYPRLERTVLLALAAMRAELSRFVPADRPTINRMVVAVTAPWTMPLADREAVAQRFAPMARRVGLEKVVVKVQIPDDTAPGGLRDAVLHFEGVGRTVLVREDTAGDQPVSPLSGYKQKVLTAARFGSPYPYEIAKLFGQLNPRRSGLAPDTFVELDLDDTGEELVPVDRLAGSNTAHIVVGLLTNHTEVVPEGITRVALLSDPTQGLGNLAEPECRRINAALAYAAAHQLPVEWFAVSSGALIAMDSGTENMDWIALTLRRLIEFTQAGGEINIVVTGINVGGQPYWNAEATMLTHTRGILVMTPASAMVLTGKQALDFSGAVSAEDNFGIGGYDRVMGPNGQAQYWAPSFTDACRLLLRHYDLTYVVPGERFPRRRPTADPADRDVRPSPHAVLADSPFTTVGDVFSADLNPERKQPFDMRSVMRAVADADSEPLERWKDLRDGDTSIVWDTTVGGIPVLLLGLESHTVRRTGYVPADGPPAWTSGTLFPHSSRKTARSINAASGNRPLVVLANLSGFDGSPESMRRRQLEFGAEIGRAVTNFDGPIVFVVVSRYHGGAFVVFSKALNESMEIAAVEGSYASVIGGAPAAATVFARDVKQRTERDPRVVDARQAVAGAAPADAAAARARLAELTAAVRSEKLGEVADEFDSIHTIERAQRVGSVDRIIAAADLRPYVIDALERGMARFT